MCRRAVGPHDYVLRILDDVIGRKHLFLVFSKNDNLIGMSNYTPIFDRSAWLGMARTDPDWRGLGVAQILQKNMASYAKRHGVNTLRFFILSTNTSSLRAAEKGKFKIVAHAAHASLNLSANEKLGSLKSNLKELKCTRSTLFNSLSRSRYLKTMNGYISRGYAFVLGNRKNLEWIMSHNELFCYEESSMFVLCRTEPSHGQFSLLYGATKDCLRNVILKSRELRLKSLGGFLPYDENMIRASENLGFKRDSWGKHALLFEKKV